MEHVHVVHGAARQHYTMRDERGSGKRLKPSGPGPPGAVDTATVFTSCNAFLSFQEPCFSSTHTSSSSSPSSPLSLLLPLTHSPPTTHRLSRPPALQVPGVMFPAVQLQRTARHPPPPPRSRTLPRLILKGQRLSPPSPSLLALVRLHRRPPRRHFQVLRVILHVVRFIPRQKTMPQPSPSFHARADLFPFPFLLFPHPHTSNCVVTNCLTDAVAQVNCSSITAVACYCANQYVNLHLLSLLKRGISPCSHPLPSTKTGHSQPHSTPVSHPIAALTCPQRKALPSDSARSTTSRSPSRLPPLCPSSSPSSASAT